MGKGDRLKLKTIFSVLIVICLIGLGIRVVNTKNPAFDYVEVKFNVTPTNNGSFVFSVNATGFEYPFCIHSVTIKNKTFGYNGVLVGYIGKSISNVSNFAINEIIKNDTENCHFNFSFYDPIILNSNHTEVNVYWNSTRLSYNITTGKRDYVHVPAGYYFLNLSNFESTGTHRIILCEKPVRKIFYIE